MSPFIWCAIYGIGVFVSIYGLSVTYNQDEMDSQTVYLFSLIWPVAILICLFFFPVFMIEKIRSRH